MIAEELHGCKKCGRDLPRSHFYTHEGSRSGLHYWCRECCRSRMSLHARSKKYNISRDEVEVLLQIPCCQLCGASIDSDRAAKFDHCHSTGRLRGVLCNRCNTAMHAVDNAELFPRLIAYRDRHREQV